MGLTVLIIAGLWSASALFLALNKVDFTLSRPTMIIQYWAKYGNVLKFKKTLQLSTFFGLAVTIIPLWIIYLVTEKKEKLHGDAKFAKSPDIKKAGFFDKTDTSILVGEHQGRLLCYNGNEFVSLAAKTRSGKGVGFILPNCLNYVHSMLVLDIKRENYDKSSGYRSKVLKQKVFIFSPFSNQTHRYNPLSYISTRIEDRVSDIIQLSFKLYPDNHKEDNFFVAMARDMFVGFVLYIMDTPNLPLTLGYIRRMGTGFGKPLNEYIEDIINNRPANYPILSVDCTEKLAALANQSNKTLSSIAGTFSQPLALWTSGYVDMATSGNDFDFRELRRQKITIYFNLPPEKVDEAKVLVNLFFSQAISTNLDALPSQDKTLKYQLLIMADEFTAPGEIAIIKHSISYIAGYNIRLCMVYQNRPQLIEAYGDAGMKMILGNVRLTIIYTPTNDPIQDSKDYSEMLGYRTVKGRSVSRGGGRNGLSYSESDQKRALMLPQELRAMPDEDEIILSQGTRPIYCKKIVYWKDKRFTPRLLEPLEPPILDVHAFMLEREGLKIKPLDDETILSAEYDIDMVADIDKIFSKIDENTSEAEIYQLVDEYFAEKTGLPLNEISNL